MNKIVIDVSIVYKFQSEHMEMNMGNMCMGGAGVPRCMTYTMRTKNSNCACVCVCAINSKPS